MGGGEAIDSSCPWLVKGRKKGYMVSDPDDIGTVRLVGWLMMVSCTNSTYSFFFLGSRLVCELGPLSIPKAHGAVRDRQWILLGLGLFEGQG